jgi:ketosteroid isomerase-like protein
MTQEESNADDNVAIARAAYEAYVAKDRAAIERLIAPDFHFTSPLDNRIVSAIPRSSPCAKTKSLKLKSILVGQYRMKPNLVAF